MMQQVLLDFKEPTISDRDWVTKLTSYANFNNSEYSFGSTYMWRRYINKRIARYKDFFLARACLRECAYLFPAGKGDVREAIELLRADAEENDQPLRFYSVTPEIRGQLDELYPGQFEYEDCRYAYDYVYESSDLISLSGRKYHGKRNHISRFDQDNPNWTYEDIDHHNLCDCWDMFEEWLQEDKNGSSSYDDEMLALRDTLDYFDELGMQGGLLRVDGTVIAVTIGEPLTDDCFDLHFEKAFSGIQGAYPKINQVFAQKRLSGYRYINREEDMGIEGLRRAKLSYQPALLVEKSYAVWKDED